MWFGSRSSIPQFQASQHLQNQPPSWDTFSSCVRHTLNQPGDSPNGGTDCVAKTEANTTEFIEFPSCSNLLGRLIHVALFESLRVPTDTTISSDAVARVITLLASTTPEERIAAMNVMRKELKYDLFTVLRQLSSADARRLQTALLAGSSPTELAQDLAPKRSSTQRIDERLAREHLARVLDHANIFPRRRIDHTFAEKLILLGDYLELLTDALSSYPTIIKRLPERTTDSIYSPELLSITRSISVGAWKPFNVSSVDQALSSAHKAITRSAQLVAEFRKNDTPPQIEQIEELLLGLALANQFAIDFGIDLAEDALAQLQNSPSPGVISKLFGTKSLAACEAAWGAIFTRMFLLKRAAGVQVFVSEVSEGLALIRPA